MEFLFTVRVEPDEEDGGFVATIATLPGVVGQGETEEEAIQDVHAALMFTLESMRERGEELPTSDESARELPTFEESRERGFRTELVV
jgi:predicted RNase H-like HicB family nuclease